VITLITPTTPLLRLRLGYSGQALRRKQTKIFFFFLKNMGGKTNEKNREEKFLVCNIVIDLKLIYYSLQILTTNVKQI